MALTVASLSMIGYANGRKVYAYSTNDDNAAILTNGYFDDTYPERELEKGDLIIASVDEDGTMKPAVYTVTVGGADVTVSGGISTT